MADSNRSTARFGEVLGHTKYNKDDGENKICSRYADDQFDRNRGACVTTRQIVLPSARPTNQPARPHVKEDKNKH